MQGWASMTKEQMFETHPLKARLAVVKIAKQANAAMQVSSSSPIFTRIAGQRGCDCSIGVFAAWSNVPG